MVTYASKTRGPRPDVDVTEHLMDSDDMERTGLGSAEPEAEDRARDSDADTPPEASKRVPSALSPTVKPGNEATVPEEGAVNVETTTTAVREEVVPDQSRATEIGNSEEPKKEKRTLRQNSTGKTTEEPWIFPSTRKRNRKADNTLPPLRPKDILAPSLDLPELLAD